MIFISDFVRIFKMRENAKVAVGIATLLTGQLVANTGIYFLHRIVRADRYFRTDAALQHRSDGQERREELRELQKKDKKRHAYAWRPMTKRITKTLSLW